jgi:hypothetical protein
METALHLLKQDGAMRVVFRPKLTPDQFAELYRAVEQADTKEELRECLVALALSWGDQVEFDSL